MAGEDLPRGLARFGVARKDASRLGGLVALGVVGLGCGLVTPWLLARIIDAGVLGGRLELLPWLGVGFLVALSCEEAVGYGAAMGRARYGLLVARRLRTRLLSHYFALPAARYAALSRGTVVQHLGENTAALQHYVADVLLTLPVQGVTVVAVLAALLWLSPLLTLVALVALPALLLLALGFVPGVRDRRREAATAGARTMRWLETLLGHAGTLRAFGRGDWAVERYAVEERARAAAMRRFLATSEATSRIARLGTGVVTVAILCLGAWQVAAGVLSLGELLAFNALALRLFGPLRNLVRARAEHAAAEAVWDELGRFLAEPHAPSGGDEPFRWGERLALDGVSFAYADDRPVLDGLDLALRPGERTGVVGESGAGKSTLLALLSRLVEPSRGSLTCDGRPVDSYDLAGWRAAVRLLEQDAPLLSGSIAENVALGLPPELASDPGAATAIADAINAAGLSETIARFPRGTSTPVGEAGAALSGGERRRVALARTLVGRPRLLLLDEPFAGLDGARRAELREVLRGVDDSQDRPAIVLVSHELRDLAGVVDRAVVLAGGRVVWDGDAATLLALREARERVAFPDAPADSITAANEALSGAGLSVALEAAAAGGWQVELVRAEVDPLEVVRCVREAVPQAGRVVLGPATLRFLEDED